MPIGAFRTVSEEVFSETWRTTEYSRGSKLMRLGSFGAFHNGHGFGAIPFCIDDLANRIDHELGLLVVDVVAAVGFRDVLRARHELREILLRRLLRGVDDVPKVWRSVGWQRARSDEGRNLRSPGPVGGQHYKG